MNRYKALIKLTVITNLMIATSIFAAPIIEGQPESMSGGSVDNYALAQQQPIANNNSPTMQVQTSADPDSLVDTVTQLQQQVRDLQGQLEVQSHQIDQLTQAQKNIYLQLEQKSPANAAVDSAATALTNIAVDSAKPTPAPKPAQGVSVNPNVSAATATSVAATTTAAATNNADEDKQKQLYNQAYQAISSQHYTDANVEMTDYLNQYPKGTYAANAHYWLGEIGLVGGNLDGAQGHFQAVVDQFSTSPKVPDAELKLGYIYYQQGKWATARQTLQNLVQQYPNSSAASLATQRLQDMTRQGV